MFLKALTLQGFKTFAQRTNFSFEPGITAIVGPNGSGKSNVADAIRWVLGEQSMRSLRGRRTEDVLFAGGSARAPAGMAEVTLSFDNSRHWLDVPFDEVSVARRAYRSGENEYYLNRDRVRLRDVADVLGRVSLGTDGFAIVGQGTIGAALSLRPEDRRALIEQAAAIGHLYLRLDDARGRLTLAEQNLARVADLATELTPRVRSLERQARQARERDVVQAEFFQGLIRWYAHLWHGPHLRRQQALAEGQASQEKLATARRAVASAERGLRDTRDRRTDLERRMVAATARLNALRSETQALDQAAALDRARRNDLARQHAEYQRLLDQHCQELERERGQASDLEIQRVALADRLANAKSELAAADAAAATWRDRRVSLERAVREAHRIQTRAESQHAGATARERAAQDRLGQLDQAIADHDKRIALLEVELVEKQDRAAECLAVQQDAQSDLDCLAAERSAENRQSDQAQAEVARLAAQLGTIDRDLHGLRARHDALQQVETNGSGYFAGVRAVLQAANAPGQTSLEGIVGVVAKLLVVSADKELAIETALGGHLQDVVVNRWVDAEAAIDHLKKSGVGRATFLPLDTLRPNRRPAPPAATGLLGVASSLVDVDPRFEVVSAYLLGQTLIVEDMGVARRILRDCAPFWQIVTLEGEITRPSGVVTGGAPGQSRGTLARQRELRVGRRAITEREQERKRVVTALTEARNAAEEVASRVAELTIRARELDERVRQATTAQADARHQAERARHTLTMRCEEHQRSVDQRTAATRALGDATQALSATNRDRIQADQSLADTQEQRARLERDIGESVARLAATRSAHDTAREQLKAVETAHAQTVARGQHLASQVKERETRLARLAEVLNGLDQAARSRAVDHERLASEFTDATGKVDGLKRRLEEALAAERDGDAECQRGQAAQRELADCIRDAERRDAMAVAEIDGLRQRILLEIGTLDDGSDEQGELRVVLPSGSQLIAPIDALTEPERLQSRVDSLRSRMRSLPVGLDTVAEYEAARERLAHLTGQSVDLRRTIATLREAIDETRASMTSRFDDTFATVADSFSRRFVELFGGGTARLVVDGDQGQGGIEIIAQPPGKRAENLSMLSGGERALTAAALLFALIEANPPPFCILDEVDAAMDESNVGRFCTALRALSDRTQFVVITHNRRTMEAAATIYGLTVENRCESRVLAMRLPRG